MALSVKWQVAAVAAGGLVGCGMAWRCMMVEEDEVVAAVELPEGVVVAPITTEEEIVQEKQDALAAILAHNMEYRARHGTGVYEEVEEDDGDSDWEDVSDEEDEEDDMPGLEGLDAFDDDFETDEEDAEGFDDEDEIRKLLNDPAFLKEMIAEQTNQARKAMRVQKSRVAGAKKKKTVGIRKMGA